MTDPPTGTTTMGTAIAAAVFCSATGAIYVAASIQPAPIVWLFVSYAPLVTVILWLHQDARRRKIAEVLDFGFLLLVFWPMVIPWYAFKSRGRRGWRLLLGLIALIMAPHLTAWIVGQTLNRQS
jgi:hypothetical protein